MGPEPRESASVRSPLDGSRLWGALRRDPVFVAGAVCLLAVVSPYFLPVLSPEWLDAHGDRYSAMPLILVTLVAFQYRLRQVESGAERRFWNLWTLAYGAWLAEQVLTSFPATQWISWLDAVPEVLYVFFYLFIVLALQVEPHRHVDRTRGSPRRRLESAGTYVFAFGLLVYFVIIPVVLDKGLFFTYAPSLVLYVVLDGFIVLRLLRLRVATADTRWRVIYSWLLATALLWLTTDSVEAFMMAEVIPWVPSGTHLDLVWLLPLVTGLVAARARDCPFPGADGRGGEPESEEQGVIQGPWGDPLVVYAAAFPLMHFVLSSSGVLDPITGPARELFALVFLLVLAGMAIVYQKLLIAENRRVEEVRLRAVRAEHRAYHDALTGLPNRYLLLDRLEQALSRARRSNKKLSVLFLDLDRFKLINDSLGHTVGDRLLEGVAKRLQRFVRRGDTVARFGGDEFTVLAEGVRHEGDTAKIAQMLQQAVKEPFEIDGRELFITASVGISLFPDDGTDAETLIQTSDIAMYRVKEQGRDGYQHYTTTMNDQALERLQLENSLRKALSLNQFVVQYQPIVDVAAGHIQGCEALLRWRHPKKGLLGPVHFIELAEVTGVIRSVGFWVLETACRQAQAWQRGHRTPLSVAVNISARQFRGADLVRQVKTALSQSGLDPQLLELEITESLAMQDAKGSVETLRELKQLGVRISIDDFGTGYSSLSYLKQFPIDILKIDRSFVRDVDSSSEVEAIVSTVIAMGRTLGLGVLAEGVEREEQLKVLRRLGCERAQGYLFSPPVWPEELDTLLGRTLPRDPVRRS